MTAKRFDHFIAFWQQLSQNKIQKPVQSSARVEAAKASLKAVKTGR